MTTIKWPLLFFAFAAAACMMAVGIAIGFRSATGIILAFIALFIVMGFGFQTKKKMREDGEL